MTLIHRGLVIPNGNTDLGQRWIRQWLAAWRHQAITWTNVDLSSMEFCGIRLRSISQEILKISTYKMSSWNALVKLFPHSNESIGNVLINKTHLGNSFVRSSATFSQFFLVAQKIRQEWLGMTSFTRPVRWSGSIRFSWSSRWKWKQFHMFGNTIKSYHNIIFFHQNTHKRHPIAHTWGRGMGCLSWAQSTIYFLHSKRPTCTRNYLLVQNELLTHWGRDKMASIFQTAFSWMKMCEFLLKFHESLFLMVQLTIFQHWFR